MEARPPVFQRGHKTEAQALMACLPCLGVGDTAAFMRSWRSRLLPMMTSNTPGIFITTAHPGQAQPRVVSADAGLMQLRTGPGSGLCVRVIKDFSLIQGAPGFSRTFPGLKGHIMQPHTPCWVPLMAHVFGRYREGQSATWCWRHNPTMLRLLRPLKSQDISQHSHLGLNIWCHHCTCLERAPGGDGVGES